MKRNSLLLLVVLSIWACNNSSKEAAHNHPAATVDTIALEGGESHGLKPVSLNKEGKWSADESTNKNVSALQATAAELNKKGLQTAADYQQAATQLQQGLNQLVKECKMKGADHDALHLWLEPVLQETKELKSVEDINTGDRLFHSIRTRLADYNLYFS